MYKLNCLFFWKFVVKRFVSNIFDTFNKKGRQVKPKRRQENGQTWFFLKIVLSGHVLKKSAPSLFGASSFFLVHIWFTPNEGPKAFNTNFLRSQTMEVGPWTRTIDKGHLPWSNFMVHSVNWPWRVGDNAPSYVRTPTFLASKVFYL